MNDSPQKITEQIKDHLFLCCHNENLKDSLLDGNVSLMSVDSLHSPTGPTFAYFVLIHIGIEFYVS